MRSLVYSGMIYLLVFAASGAANAGEGKGDGAVGVAERHRSLSDAFHTYSIRLGVESAGPILFRDTPDQQIEATTVFQLGGRLAFWFGDELKDVHRFGLGLGYSSVATAPSRKLSFVDAYLLYETGHPLILQAGLGASFARGTTDFADQYGGLYGALALRYSFRRQGRDSKVAISPGVVAKSYVTTGDFQNSSFFLGAQLEIAYDLGR